MKKQNILLTIIAIPFLIACGEEDNVQFPTSLNVFHAVNEAPSVHVDYFEEEISLSGNPVLTFGANIQLVLPSDQERGINFISAQDTTRVLLQETVRFGEGEIHSLFLAGTGENIESVLIEDLPKTFTDSIMGIRFINLSPDSGPISVNVEGETNTIGSSLDYRVASDFNELPATREAGEYTFEFRDSNGELLTSTTFDPLPLPRSSRDRPLQRVFKNMTFVLVGLRDDGDGVSTLSVKMVDNF